MFITQTEIRALAICLLGNKMRPATDNSNPLQLI